MHPREMNELRADETAQKDLVDNPRPMSFKEAAALLVLSDDQMLALNLPVTGVIDGEEVYNSNDVIRWLDIKRSNPRAFEERIAGYEGQPSGTPPGVR
jgi:hypothetical protein